ncbi:hypothetical protein MRX96_007221 [Rhipicephalus microplus]
MGPGNTAIWRLCGVQASKYGKPKISYPPPLRIILHDTIVKKENLSSNQVFLKHIKKACELDPKHQVKLLPHLKLRDLDPSHFEKLRQFAKCGSKSVGMRILRQSVN